MVYYKCDGCGKQLAQHALRYTVEIEVRAAYDTMKVHLSDLLRDHRADILALIEQLKVKNPRELEEGVYTNLTLDLCPACQRAFVRDPLRFHPEQSGPASEINIDEFLRSLGMGKDDSDPA